MYGGSMIHYLNNEGFKSGLTRPTVSQKPRTRWEKAFPMYKNVANCRCRKLVEQKVPFQAHNIFARALRTYDTPAYPDKLGCAVLYVVYSYGLHFPMYVFDFATSTWYANTDKYSTTTGKHKSQARPYRTMTGSATPVEPAGPVMSGKTTSDLQDLISSHEKG